MKNWFGKDCEYLRAQWEEDELTGDPNYKDSEPLLVFCTHPNNKSDYEGNCRVSLCPLRKSETKSGETECK